MSSSVRKLAFEVLSRAEREGNLVQDLLPGYQARLSDARDQRLLFNLVVGVVRRGLTLEGLLRKLTGRRPQKLDRNLLWTLKIAAYQIIFLDRIPVHAAVDEAVRLTRSPKLKGFANGVLRELCRQVVQRAVATSELRVHSPRQRLMLDDGRLTVFSQPMLPSPRHHVRYLSMAYSLPTRLLERWVAHLGKAELLQVLRACNSEPPLFLRPNIVRTTSEAFLELLAQADVQAVMDGRAIRLLTSRDPSKLPGFSDGLFYVQDKTAQEAVGHLPVEPGQSVLDLCAAPGGKATALAERMQDRGEVWAVDSAKDRLAKVTENTRRLQLQSVRTVLWPSSAFDERDQPFDAALVDVPCSNTGVLRRRAEARMRFDPASLPRLVQLQRSLLLRAAERVRPGGHVLYSTCSIEPEENRQLIDSVLSPGLELVEDCLTLPRFDGGDGGYWALLRLSEG